MGRGAFTRAVPGVTALCGGLRWGQWGREDIPLRNGVTWLGLRLPCSAASAAFCTQVPFGHPPGLAQQTPTAGGPGTPRSSGQSQKWVGASGL